MMPREDIYNIEDLIGIFKPPVLIVSTIVGKGVYRIGEAIEERFLGRKEVYHIAIEDVMAESSLKEDFERYRIISNNFPFLLRLIYKIPIFYYRKYLREKYLAKTDLSKLKEKIESLKIRTLICISHRPAFWVSNLKRRENMDFDIWGVLIEFGRTLGWKYIFWEELAGFMSPVKRAVFDHNFPEKLKFINVRLPVKKEYLELTNTKGDKDKVVIICGFWGQGPIIDIVRLLIREMPQLKIYALFGLNSDSYKKAREIFRKEPNIMVFDAVESIAPFLRECASIVTKPGISTILEACAAKRKIFLLKGMPVAEDNNARFAIGHFGAEWFNLKRFKHWYQGP